MPDYWKRANINELYLPFRQLVETLHANCLKRGAEYYITSAYRSVEAQEALYAQGRTKPGPIITKARGGQSYHNFAIAVDFACDGDISREGLQPNWRPEAYQILAEEAEKLSLEAGANWTTFKDYPHVQLKISRVGLALADLRRAHAMGGMKAVEAILNKNRW